MESRILKIVVFGLMAVTLLSCGGTTSPTDCSDDVIVKTINDRLKAEPLLSDQMRTINVTSKDGEVKLYGWVKDDPSYDALMKVMSEPVECMKGYPYINVYSNEPLLGNPRRPAPGTGYCVPGTKACGDLCIPAGDKCDMFF